jgi:SAM-dependent methyltransferase
MDEIESIARCMALYSRMPEVQLAQTAFRARIAGAWGIAPGSRILEIGCGQGDMTAVLARAVGREGRVEAYDPAPPGYGAPVTIGESAERLLGSELGARIGFHLGCDLLAGGASFPDDAFDYVVLANCSWYFSSAGLFARMLERARAWAPALCLSEWDLAPREPGQFAHALAVLVQGQVEAFRDESSSNIRSPMTRETLEGLLAAARWRPIRASAVDASGLQDAGWEIDECLRSSAAIAAELALPPRFRDFLGTELGLLRELAEAQGRDALPCFALVAARG